MNWQHLDWIGVEIISLAELMMADNGYDQGPTREDGTRSNPTLLLNLKERQLSPQEYLKSAPKLFVWQKIINRERRGCGNKFILPLCAFNMEWNFSMETRDICKIPTIYISGTGFMKGKYKKWDGGISQGGRGKRSATNIPVASPNNLEEPPLFAKTMHCGLTGSRELYKDPCSIA